MGNWMAEHRTLCATLEEIRANTNSPYIHALVDECKTYAESMSNKLMEYKRAEQTTSEDRPSSSVAS